MKALGRWIIYEMRLQFKNGMYILYFIVNLLYILLLSYVPENYKEVMTTLVLLTDPTFLGMAFVGGIMLLEKNQGIPKGIGVTPLGCRGYILAKVSSLLFISLLLGGIIARVILGKQVNLWTLIISLGLGASLFTLFGIIMGTYAKGTNQFLLIMSILCLLLAPPFLVYLDVLPIEIFKWIPTYSVMCLIGDAVRGDGLIWKHVLYLVVWLVVSFEWTKLSVERRVFQA